MESSSDKIPSIDGYIDYLNNLSDDDLKLLCAYANEENRIREHRSEKKIQIDSSNRLFDGDSFTVDDRTVEVPEKVNKDFARYMANKLFAEEINMGNYQSAGDVQKSTLDRMQIVKNRLYIEFNFAWK